MRSVAEPKQLYEFNEEVKTLIVDALAGTRHPDLVTINRCLSIVAEMSLLCETLAGAPAVGPVGRTLFHRPCIRTP